MDIVSVPTLCRLHNVLNDGLFNGELSRACLQSAGYYLPPYTEIAYADFEEVETIACFRAVHTMHENILFGEEILFNVEYLNIIAGIDDEHMQIGILASILLHEMIHQHLEENHLSSADADVFDDLNIGRRIVRYSQTIQNVITHCYPDLKDSSNDVHTPLFLQDGLMHGYQYKLGYMYERGWRTAPKQRYRHRWYDLLPKAERIIDVFSQQ